MGQIVKITCASCKSEWKCKTGCGILHGDLERVAQLYLPEQCRKITDYAKQTEYPLFSFEYGLSWCPYCNHIGSVPVLRLEDENISYLGACEHCMKEVSLIDSLENVECPVCHRRKLTQEIDGMWD